MPTMHSSMRDTSPGPFARFLIAAVPVALVAFLGNLATMPNIPTWYAGLVKPSFTPPNWLFGPAWTLLYVLMAYALWRILSLPRETPGRTAAITAFFVQLALNGLWSWAFFAAHSPIAGLMVIVALVVAVIVTIRLFWPLDRVAGALLLPYLAWICFATALNGAIWQLN